MSETLMPALGDCCCGPDFVLVLVLVVDIVFAFDDDFGFEALVCAAV